MQARIRAWTTRTALALAMNLSAASLADADGFLRLSGHGGPVKGLAVSPDGRVAATASFDNAVGLWNLETGAHLRWLEGHEAAVNAVAFTPDGAGLISASDDFDLIIWDLNTGAALRRLEGHQGKILKLVVSPDGAMAASASWDGAVGLWSLTDDAAPPVFLRDHQAGVNDVIFAEAGAALFSASSDGAVRKFRVADAALLRIEARHGFGVNQLELDEERGWLAYGATDGVVRVINLSTGAEIAALTGDRRPILGLQASPDRALIAYSDGEGYISVAQTSDWSITHDFRATAQGPIWALAFADATRLMAAGLDDTAALWPIGTLGAPLFATNERRFQVDPEEVSNGERQFARKCSVCHTLSEDGKRRAGPPLLGLFGRSAGAVPGYNYSTALSGSGIVWSPETLDKLFDLGPDHYTPGSKMPMQRIVDPADRADLIAYLAQVTSADTAPDAASQQE